MINFIKTFLCAGPLFLAIFFVAMGFDLLGQGLGISMFLFLAGFVYSLICIHSISCLIREWDQTSERPIMHNGQNT